MSKSHFKKVIAINPSDDNLDIEKDSNVSVFIADTGFLATIFTTRDGGTIKSNPFVASDGLAEFYGDPGRYDIIADIDGSPVAVFDDFLLFGEGLTEPEKYISAEFATANDMIAGDSQNLGAVDWADYVGRKVWVVAQNSQSGEGGQFQKILNANPGNLSTLVGGIWVGGNHDLGGGYYSEMEVDGGPVHGHKIGLVANGVDDDLAVLEAAKSYLNPLGYQLGIANLDMIISSDYELPRWGLSGSGSITGANVTLSNSRQEFIQDGGKFIFDYFYIGNSQYSKFEDLEAATGTNFPALIVRGSNDSDVGFTGWNEFEFIRAVIQIDVSEANPGSVNQNTFGHCRGGLWITGGSELNPFVQEADQNDFGMIDTTGSQVQDSTGFAWGILNDSYLNQRNIIRNWYTEGSAGKAISGNFHVLSSYADVTGSPYALPPTAHVLFNPDHSQRNRGDYFAGNSADNKCIGGNWDILKANVSGQPVGYERIGSWTIDVVADATEPTGVGYVYGGSTSTDFNGLRIRMPRCKSGTINAFFWLRVVSGRPSFQIERDGSLTSWDYRIFHQANDDWRLYRLSSRARDDGGDEIIQILTMNDTDPSCELYLGTCYATDQKTAFLPTGSAPEARRAISLDGTVVKADALPIGGIVENRDSAITSADVASWIKDLTGTLVPLVTVP